MQEPDPATIRAAAAGDLDAFEALVRTYQEPIWRFLRHLVGDPTQAEDLAQETFLRAFRRLRSFAFRSKFSTWLFQIARNAAVDALRSRDRSRRLVVQLAARPAPPDPDPSLGPALTEALATLSPALRDALVLVEVAGFTCREAGEVLGVPEGTIKSRLHTARHTLVAWFTADEEVRRDQL